MNDTIPLQDIEFDDFFKVTALHDKEAEIARLKEAEHARLMAELDMIGSSPLEPETTAKDESGPAGPIPVEDVVGINQRLRLLRHPGFRRLMESRFEGGKRAVG